MTRDRADQRSCQSSHKFASFYTALKWQSLNWLGAQFFKKYVDVNALALFLYTQQEVSK